MGHSTEIRQVDPATTSKFVETFRVCREFFADHLGNKLFLKINPFFAKI